MIDGKLSSQDFDKLVDAHHIDVVEGCLFENIVVMVFCNDIAGISLESATNLSSSGSAVIRRR